MTQDTFSHAPRLTVFGSFGFGNLGDELVPECFAHLLQASGRSARLQAMSRFGNIPPGPSAPYPRETLPEDLVRDPGGQTLVLAGGGIVEPRPMSCMHRAFALADRVPGLRLAAHAISVEPGVRFSWRQRRVLRRQLERLEAVTVRDALSAEVLGTLVPGRPVEVIGDIALWLEPQPVPEELERDVPQGAIPVILTDTWKGDDFLDWMAGETARLARTLDRPLLMLPISGMAGEDMAIHARLRDRLARMAADVEVAFPGEHLPASLLTPGVAGALMARAPLTVSMRLHGCVMSYAVGTPFVGLAYHPKLQGFARTVGWPHALVPRTLPPRQSPGTYGYRFADLGLRPGALFEAAEAVLKDPDFSAIPYFRRLQTVAIDALLEKLSTP